jgi:hypothetical protein
LQTALCFKLGDVGKRVQFDVASNGAVAARLFFTK